MKQTLKFAAIAAALTASAWLLTAQQADRPPREGGRPGGPPDRPMIPIIAALDANNDRQIDAAEIANATAALKKLDQNGDGKLSPEEYLPRRPGVERGPRERGDRPEGARPERRQRDRN